jgi:hypothetical protein
MDLQKRDFKHLIAQNTVLRNRMISVYVIYWKARGTELTWPYLKYCPNIFLEGRMNTMKKCNYDGWSAV